MPRKYDYRRKLPHIQGDQQAFFITFCTADRWPLPAAARVIAMKSCIHEYGCLFDLHGVAVMPDHVHLVLTPFTDADGPVSLPEILQRIKSASAHLINKALDRRGKVWQDESFDRALRRDEEISAYVEYLLGNPARAGLVMNPLDYRWMWRAEQRLPWAG